MPCSAGKYSNESSALSCRVCPTNATSPAGSSAVTNCTCNAGWSGPDGGTCALCVAGKYKPESARGSEACSDCEQGKYSETASSSCTPCDAGKYWTGTGGSSCTACGAGKYGVSAGQTAESSCTVCGAGKYGVATGQTSCTACGAGKFGVATGQTAEEGTCALCVAGKYNPAAGSVACTDCGAGKYGVATGQTAEEGTCTVCVAGKYNFAAGSVACTDCGAGKYGVATGLAFDATSCLVCPPNSNSPPGSTSVTICTCNAGSTGPSGGPCSLCEAGKFKDAPGTAACITCVIGKYGAAGAATESECIYCPEGKFGGREGSSTCKDCETGKVSDRGEVACRRATEASTQPTPAPASTASPTQPTPAPSSTASPPSLNAMVEITIKMPFTKAAFTAEKQSSFRSAVAATAMVPAENVAIVAVQEVSTRRAATSLEVKTQIRIKDDAAASSLVASWDTKTLNTELKKQGIPEATSVSQPVKRSSKEENNADITFILIITASGVLFVAVTVLCYYFIKKTKKGAVQPHKARWKTTDPRIVMGLERDHAEMFALLKGVLPEILQSEANYAADKYDADKAAADEADAAATNALEQDSTSEFLDLQAKALKARAAAEKSRVAADKAASNAKLLKVREVLDTDEECTEELTLGLKWKEAGSEKPSTGTEIQNKFLAAALQKQDEFTQEEWAKFQVAGLSSNSYIKAGDRYFKPSEMGMDQTGGDSKFEQPRMLVYGPATESTLGIIGFMGVDQQSFFKGLSEGMQAIIREVEDKSEVVEIQQNIEELQRERNMLISRVRTRTISRLEGPQRLDDMETITDRADDGDDSIRIKQLDEEIEHLKAEAKELDEEIEDSKFCLNYCLYEAAGSCPRRFQNGWKMDCGKLFCYQIYKKSSVICQI
jgi:hypothetical protein